MGNVSRPLPHQRKTEKRKLNEGSAVCSCFELGKKNNKAGGDAKF